MERCPQMEAQLKKVLLMCFKKISFLLLPATLQGWTESPANIRRAMPDVESELSIRDIQESAPPALQQYFGKIQKPTLRF